MHRDLKPDNIFLAHEPGEETVVKLIDFGISKITSTGHSKMTSTGMMLGTPSYMSAEQIRGLRDVDHRTDIYAMGVVLYEMLTGKLPFVGEHYNALVYSVMTDEPIPPGKAYKDFPKEVEPLLMRTLSKSPDKRPKSASALLDEIRHLTDFGSRREHLSRYSSGLIKKSVAGGALGSSIQEGQGASAADVLDELAKRSTPADWAKTTLIGKKKRTRLLLGAALVSVVAVGALAGVLLLGTDEKKTEPAAVPAAYPPPPDVAPAAPPVPAPVTALESASIQSPDEQVWLEVTGAPDGAEIVYDGVRRHAGEFAVERSTLAAELKVRAPGYEDFALRVAPDKNRTIAVNLTPVAKEKKSRKKASEKEEKKATAPAAETEKTEPPPPTPPPHRKPEIVRDGKAKLTESFDD